MTRSLPLALVLSLLGMSEGEEMATGEDEAGYALDRNAQTRVRN